MQERHLTQPEGGDVLDRCLKDRRRGLGGSPERPRHR